MLVPLAVPVEPVGDLVLGIGLGESVGAALAAGRRVRVWEWSPHLLLRWLSTTDLEGPLQSGQLQLLLGADLVGTDLRAATVHPLFGPIYAPEIEAARDPSRPLALIFGNNLMESEVRSAFAALGWRTWRWAESWPAAYGEDEARRLRARMVFTINLRPGLPEVVEALGMDYRSWEIDPRAQPLPSPRAPLKRSHVYTWRRQGVEALAAAGYPASWLPLAADPDLRRPGPPDPHLAGPVSYAGSSIRKPAEIFRARFTELGEGAGLDAALALLREDPYLPVADAIAAAWPGALGRPWPLDPVTTTGEIAAHEWRMARIRDLAPLGVQVWGDRGWRGVARWRGMASPGEQLTSIYRSSTVNLDITRPYQRDIVTLRVFDIAACGALVLAEHNEDLERLFEVGREVESWRSPAELREKVAWYAAHPTDAAAIGARGRDRVLAGHTTLQRVRHILDAGGVGVG